MTAIIERFGFFGGLATAGYVAPSVYSVITENLTLAEFPGTLSSNLKPWAELSLNNL